MNAMNAWFGNTTLLFGGKSKKDFPSREEQFSFREEELERRLKNAGINAETLDKDWGVTLWTLRAKDDEVKIKIDVQKKSNPNLDKLQKLFEKALGFPVSLKLKSVEKCCGSPCQGCIAWKGGDPERRKDWLG